MKPIRFTGTALSLFLLVGIATPIYAQGNSGKQDNGDKQEKSDKKEKDKSQGKSAKQQGKHQEQKAVPQAPQQHQQVQQQQHAQQQAQAKQQQDRPPGWDNGKKTGWGNSSVPPGQQARLSHERQQENIRQQQQSVVQYRQRLNDQQHVAQQYNAQLQQQNRMAEYRYQQQYIERMRQQQIALQRSRNYNTDPYYYTAPIYSYNRSGSYYETNQYGANSLRQAVNYGYAQGYQAGQAARQDRWSSGYQNSYAYQDANYGYDGYYVGQDDYNYYFRQGFSRGYEDGYGSRYQYGQYSSGSYNILGAVLSQILNLQSLR